MWFGAVTLFPDLFQGLTAGGVTAQAIHHGQITLQLENLRKFSNNRYGTIDDKPYGGGPGLLMMPDPLIQAIESLEKKAPIPPKIIYLSPQGKLFNQEAALQFAQLPAILFIAGRYEGIDERVLKLKPIEEWSIGDYVLSGGELAAMVMMDAIARLLPGVVGDADSVKKDSLFNNLLKHPQYTRPDIYAGIPVPPILLNGHHKHIEQWRKKQSLLQTWLKRPDLLDKYLLTPEEAKLLDEAISEYKSKKSS